MIWYCAAVKINKVYTCTLMWTPDVGFDLEADMNLRFFKNVYCHVTFTNL